jgi:hypothetical protein
VRRDGPLSRLLFSRPQGNLLTHRRPDSGESRKGGDRQSDYLPEQFVSPEQLIWIVELFDPHLKKFGQ